MAERKRVLVERHDRLYRALHWLIVAEMLVLLITGLATSARLDIIPFISRGLGRAIHIVVGFAWLMTITWFLYYFIYSGEYRWFGLRRLGEALDALVDELHTLLRGQPLEEPIRYDAERGDYVEKIYPTEVIAWWGWALIWTVLAFTGLALVYPRAFAFIHGIAQAVLPAEASASAATRLIHLVFALGMVVFMTAHVVLVVLTGLWRGIIVGTREEPVVEPGEMPSQWAIDGRRPTAERVAHLKAHG